VTCTPEDARQIVADLQAANGGVGLGSLPLGQRDQVEASVREFLDGLGLDVADRKEMWAAFAGAFVAAGYLIPHGMYTSEAFYTTLFSLQAILARSDEAASGRLVRVPAALESVLSAPPPKRRRWWRR